MNNKNLILILIILSLTVVVLFFFTKEDKAVPLTAEATPVENLEENDYTGLSVTEANAKANANGVMFRVVEKDGEAQAVTQDFLAGRVNATVENDIVTKYFIEKTDPVLNISNEAGAETGPNSVIIGMTIPEALAYTSASNIPFRIGVMDGELLPITTDIKPGRITAKVSNGVVEGYTLE